MYTVPYQSLRYWHDAKSISTSPRLTRQSYGKMVRVADELARKLKVMRSPNWRANPTASPPEMDSTSDFIENQVMSEPAERNKISGNGWERGSSALRPRMDSDVETNGSSPLTTASTPTTTADTPITPLSLPDSCTATPTIPSSPLPSLGRHGRTSNVARSSKRLVYTRAALLRCRGEAIPDTSSKR
ncbi:uncharacterized protein B0T23DRAFT_400543 [Neurospora hispaniola]|uniref:Uncharacterized protein n=1 Tax=Neurospora hispaniola TaxID=588809 RepID=A0AAJ0IEC7_9PEZI|nr:hypothetical protein B0T23DRAFT_400543 [Neurospora hispaniola]